MSGLLFLFAVAGFVLIAYWAYRNDKMGMGECGTGILVMRAEAPKTKPVPKWRKKTEPPAATASPASSATGGAPGWKRGFLHSPRP